MRYSWPGSHARLVPFVILAPASVILTCRVVPGGAAKNLSQPYLGASSRSTLDLTTIPTMSATVILPRDRPSLIADSTPPCGT